MVLLHPGDEFLQQRLGLPLVPDEVVVDDERRVETGAPHVVQLGHQLLRFLDPGPAAIDHDDVAELALEGAAARVLQRPGSVPIDLEQIVSRARHLGHVGRLRLFVTPLGRLRAGEGLQELRPDRFRFPDEHHVTQVGEELLLHRNQRAADRREDVQFAQPQENLAKPRLLHIHSRDAHKVILAQGFPVDVLDILVQQVYVVVAAERRQRGQRTGDHGAPLVARVQRQGVLETPIGRFKARVDQTDGQRPSRGARGSKREVEPPVPRTPTETAGADMVPPPVAPGQVFIFHVVPSECK